MNEFDSGKAARVWQRVQNERQEPPTPQKAKYAALMMDQWQISAHYLQLSHRVSGKTAAVLLRLARENRAQAMCLCGICALLSDQVPVLSTTSVQPAPIEAMLRRCYGQEMRSLKTYGSLCTDAEFGTVFERMVHQKREQCCLLLELIGELGRK